MLIQNSSQSISDWMKVTFSLRYDVPAWAIYGVLLILLMYFMPRGIMGGIEGLWLRVTNRKETQS